MTVKDILDQIVHGSGDDTGAYRSAALRWLNLARAEIADAARWRTAFNPEASFTTTSANVDGVYALSGYSEVSGNHLYNETEDAIIIHDSFEAMQSTDPAESNFGPPTWWADAGMSTAGTKLIVLRPIPATTYTIRFAGYRVLTDLVAAQETHELDPYFGIISPWGPTFVAGARYYMEQDDNTDAQQVALTYARFYALIRQRKARNTVAPATIPAQDVRAAGQVATGRFDPAHYNNKS